MKIVKSLENTSLLIKGVSETIKSEAKKQNGRFLSVSLGTLQSFKKYLRLTPVFM